MGMENTSLTQIVVICEAFWSLAEPDGSQCAKCGDYCFVDAMWRMCLTGGKLFGGWAVPTRPVLCGECYERLAGQA